MSELVSQRDASGSCLDSEAIEALAAGGTPSATESAHITSCEPCQTAVEELRSDMDLLGRLRSVLGLTDSVPLPVPENLIPGYRLVGEINRGSQGIVYKAVQERTKRTVAVKMLLGGRFASHKQRSRFEREIEIAASLNHPGIVTIYDNTPVPGGRVAYAMEYIEGSVPLDAWRTPPEAGTRAEVRTKLVLFAEICDAVHYAHQRGVMHRDLKPANILIDSAGRPHVLDFGIAKATGSDLSPLTQTIEFAGTLAYASPEQITERPDGIDVRTDVYSLGVILFEMLTGRLPHVLEGRSIAEAAQTVTQRDAPRLRSIDRAWRGDLDTIAAKALERDVGRRYQSAAELAGDVRRHLAGHTIEARRTSTWYMLRKTAARHRIVFAAAGLIIVLLAAFGTAMTWQAHRLEVRGRELAGALNASNLERGRSLAAAGNIPLAEDTVFPELIRAGVTRIDGPEMGFTGAPEALHAYWGLWDVFRSSRCVATLRTLDHPTEEVNNFVRLLYFDEDGQRLNAFDKRGRLVSWSVATWETVRDTSLLPLDEGQNYRTALAPNGNIAVFGPEGMIRVVNPESGQVEAQGEDPDDEAMAGTFSPDGTLIATAGSAKQLRVRDAGSPATVVMTADGVGWNPDVPTQWGRPTFSTDGEQIAAVRPDGSLGLWNTKSGALERSLRPPASLTDELSYLTHTPFGKLAIAPDGTIASQYGLNLVVWPADGGVPRDFGEPGGSIETVAFLPGSEGWMVVSSGGIPASGGITTIWDLASGNRRATFMHPGAGVALAISPDARLLVVGMMSGMVQVYEATPEPHVTALQAGRIWPYSSMAISPDGQRLAIVTSAARSVRQDLLLMDQDVLLIDIKSRATIRQFRRTGPQIVANEFAPDGLSLFEFDLGCRVKQWDVTSASCVQEFAFPEPYTIEPDPVGINHVRLSPDGRILARSRGDGLIGLWDVPSGLWIGVLESGASGDSVIDFSPDGRTLVAQHLNTVVLWDVETRRPKRTIALEKRASINGVRFSPDGRLITRNVEGRLQFCDAETDRVLSECSPRTAGAGMAFHPDGRILFALAWDRSIRLWDTRTGRELLSLQKHSQYMRGLLMTPDGNTLISSDFAGTVLVWDLTYYNDRIRRELEYRASHSTTP